MNKILKYQNFRCDKRRRIDLRIVRDDFESIKSPVKYINYNHLANFHCKGNPSKNYFDFIVSEEPLLHKNYYIN
jgi:hypothetical protein